MEQAHERYNERYTYYKEIVENTLREYLHRDTPAMLYDPIRYVMLSGGKRVRPVLTMLCCEAVGGTCDLAQYSAVAVELVHNFTLVHDDIMDAAPMRRNLATVHTRWNDSAAILAGDCMIALAYSAALKSNSGRMREIVDAFSTGIAEVCEGQALDLEFQQKEAVTLGDYLLMIEKKTAKMLELAAKVGGYIGNGTDAHIEALRQYAGNLGLAFQIQDDLLDASADQEQFGKTVGGDIMEGKKTYLILRALQQASTDEDIALLGRFVHKRGLAREEVSLMQELFERNGIFEEARTDVERLIGLAHSALDTLPDSEARAMLHWFADMLLDRKH